MNFAVAAILVVVTMCDAEPSRFRPFQRQSVLPVQPLQPNSNTPEAPYPAAGYRPAGAQFALPQQAYGRPTQSYGPPPQGPTTELPETTTSDFEDTTTIEPQAENIKVVKQDIKTTKGNTPLLLVVPRTQNYIAYASVGEYPEEADSPEIIAYPQIQNAPIYTTRSKLQALPLSTASVYNPYAYFQIYQ